MSEQDGRARAEESPETYDRILVDAPCTGLGALRRRPEARWRKSPADVPELTQLQGELLTAADRRAQARRDRRLRHVLAAPRRDRRRGRRCAPRVGSGARRARRPRRRQRRSRMPTPICRRRPTAPAALSCGRTGTTPTRCRSRCCAGSERWRTSLAAGGSPGAASTVELRPQRDDRARDAVRASSLASTRHDRLVRQRSWRARAARRRPAPRRRSRVRRRDCTTRPSRRARTRDARARRRSRAARADASRTARRTVSTMATPRTLLPCASRRGLNAATPNCDGRHREQPAADAALRGQPDAQQPLAREVVHAAARHDRQHIARDALLDDAVTAWSGSRRRTRASPPSRRGRAPSPAASTGGSTTRPTMSTGPVDHAVASAAGARARGCGRRWPTPTRTPTRRPTASAPRTPRASRRCARSARRRRRPSMSAVVAIAPALTIGFAGRPVPSSRLIALNGSPLGSAPTF